MLQSEIIILKGCNLEQLTQAFFDRDYMRYVNSSHHKNNDGALEVNYNWYYDNDIQGSEAWEVYHPGYVRGEIRGTGRTLQEAIDAFIDAWISELIETGWVEYEAHTN